MKKIDAGITLSIFVISMVMYLRTLAPSLLYGDSAEFQTIAFTLGIGHPTGYPVYVLLAKIFTFLPMGDIAYRVNLFSAFCGACTVMLIFLILRKLGSLREPAVFGALILAMTPLFWKHATIAEVYTTSAAFIALILYAVLSWNETRNPHWLFIAGFFGGLSLGIHTTVALGGLAILLFLALSTRKPVDWLHAVIGALSGLSLFILTFLFLDHFNASAGYYNATTRHALSVWNMSPADFDSPYDRFIFLYFPPQFSGNFFAVPGELVRERLREFFSGISWSLLIALIGLVSFIIPRKNSSPRWREAILLWGAIVIFLFFAVSYDVTDYQVYFIPVILFLAIAIGLGFSVIIEAVSHLPKMPKIIPGFIVMILIANLLLSQPDSVSSLKSRIPPITNDYEAKLYTSPDTRRIEAELIIDKVEDNAIIFTDWERVYDLYYVAYILQKRTDMDFHQTYPQDNVSRLAESTLAYIEANIDTRPIYFTERPIELANQYKILPAGAGLYQITEEK